jgi:hypothetical protein
MRKVNPHPAKTKSIKQKGADKPSGRRKINVAAIRGRKRDLGPTDHLKKNECAADNWLF